MQDDSAPVEVQASVDREATPKEFSTTGLVARQYLLGWSQPPKIAVLQGGYLFLLPGFLVLLLGSEFVQVAGLRGEPLNLPSALFIGTMMLIYLALVVLPALAVLVLGLADWRAQPRLMGGQVLAVRHLPGRTSQGHYILLETPDGRRVRLRLDPLWHNQCCHVGARVALSVSPRLRHVSKVWSEAGEPPVLV